MEPEQGLLTKKLKLNSTSFNWKEPSRILLLSTANVQRDDLMNKEFYNDTLETEYMLHFKLHELQYRSDWSHMVL